ncbi:DNA topoisomerase III [Desulforamulus ruminis]|uniref:DNA topoisomerase 3 n=1 Tax=Desulforamulus ruminis (strain ATCC 23193 / DSM 2154 / NCIMB 8452 / DL) TaxID=696281 RepID=F6DQM0_DESRL|nr:DNA topoisomerase III [Desulforamulus ruminis]AEG62017.1 DNA topoisomerase III [Desulforamulus ruminis DSM 2154]
MNKTLVLAEKPSVARDLARVLNCGKKGNGYFEGDQYIVTWALGHLVTLADPEAYDQKYHSWRLEDLPILPSYLKLVVIKQSSRQFYTVTAQMNRKDVAEIVIATDAGREGELVARWIIEKAQVKKAIKRLWISSVTDKAIRDGFRSLKKGQAYEHLYASAVARAEADWLVGINATRALTCKHNAQLSCGRVQTPTLAIIAKREEEIKNFKPKNFYGITAVSNGLKLTWQDSRSKDTKTFDADYCDKILLAIKNKPAEIIEVEKAHKKSFPPQLYDLTELQRDANRLFGYSAKETLSHMQRLYEHHKVLTYPRTDSRYLSTDMVETLKDRVEACRDNPYTKMAFKILKNPIQISKSFVDNSKVSDHHAIIPTEQPLCLSALNDKERKIYDLVVRRFLAVLYPPFEYEQTTLKAKIGQELFIAKGKRVLAQGWKEVYDNQFEDEDQPEGLAEQRLPGINKGDRLKISSISQTKGETKPPEPFNEGSLLSAMENPTKYMANQDKELIKTIGKTGGLGTVATRADIIEKLFNSFLIEKKGKHIFITSKGRQLLELVPGDLKAPDLTAEWEQKLEAIAKGVLNKNHFIDEMKQYAKLLVHEVKNSENKFRHDNLTGNKCPQCGKRMLEVNGKKGKMLVCQDRECGYRKGLSKITNARCPNCHKRMELHGEGEGQIFVCPCGYREKLTAFNERRGKEKTGSLSKKELSQYLQNQKKDEKDGLMNTALADALAKLKQP